MIKYFILAFLIGAGCMACSSYKIEKIKYAQIEVDSTFVENAEISAIIAPYSDSLKEEMDEVIGYAKGNFFKARPAGELGNLVAEITREYALNQIKLDTDIPVISILNNGGLRSPISEGKVSIGDIFKLMPFDNTIVVLRFKGEVLKEIFSYLEDRKGEPVAGLQYGDGLFKIVDCQPNELPEYVFVVTTDYLANGGDNMTFMSSSDQRINTDALLRDVIIQYVKANKTLQPNDYSEERLNFRNE